MTAACAAPPASALAVLAPDQPEAGVADAVRPLARAALLVVVEVARLGVRLPADVDADVGGRLRLRVARADDLERPVRELEHGDREDVVGVEVPWVRGDLHASRMTPSPGAQRRAPSRDSPARARPVSRRISPDSAAVRVSSREVQGDDGRPAAAVGEHAVGGQQRLVGARQTGRRASGAARAGARCSASIERGSASCASTLTARSPSGSHGSTPRGEPRAGLVPVQRIGERSGSRPSGSTIRARPARRRPPCRSRRRCRASACRAA